MAPTPIDFDKVFTELVRLLEGGNITVVIAISCVFGLYLVLLIWARKNDKSDLLKVRTTPSHYQCMGQIENPPLLTAYQLYKLLVPAY